MSAGGAEPGDRVRVSIRVEVEPRVAFQVFTEEIDLWWRRGVPFRPSGKAAGVLHFEPGEKTEVEVSFEPAGAGMLGSVEHRGSSSLRPGHPARHGLAGPGFSRMMGTWWAGLMRGLQRHAASRA